jgi:outer membrane receptor protein involved in Fe transport
LDALRGNTPVLGNVAIQQGGNNGLSPETSENWTAGLIVEPPFLQGLSLSIDAFDTRYQGRITLPSLTDLIAYFPSMVGRGANLPSDQPGWAGPVIFWDNRNVNIAEQRISGFDLAIAYRKTTNIGTVTLNGVMSKVTRNEQRVTPRAALSTSSTIDALPFQLSSSLFFETHGFELGVFSIYRARFRTSTTAVAFTPSAIRWDLQASYQFGKKRGPTNMPDFVACIFSNTRISATVFNFLDTQPPFSPTRAVPDNSVLDSRLRRYALNISKDF